MKIDFHAHILPETLPDMKKKSGYSGWINIKHLNNKEAVMVKDSGETFRAIDAKLWSVPSRLKIMQESGVDVQVLSTVPIMFNYWAKAEDTEYLCRHLNDHLASVIRNNEKHFVGLGTIPLQDTNLAVNEMRRLKSELKLSGVILGTNIGEVNLEDKRFDAIYRTAQELSLPLFVHPIADAQKGRLEKFMLPYLVGMPTDTTIAICSMICGGVFERFPNLRVCFAHGGGMFPYTVGRINRGFHTYPKSFQKENAFPPTEYLGRIYVDSLLHSTDSILLAKN
ncbi:hypothetical protein B4U80_06657, partial [Leptotrombidium deliense]